MRRPLSGRRLARPAIVTIRLGAGLALAAAACTTAPPPAATTHAEQRYTVELAGDGGAWTIGYEFNDRGRGPKVTVQVALDRRGLPVRLDVTGNDYQKNPVAEHFEWLEGKASWKNPAEEGQRDVDGKAFYVDMEGSPLELGLLARALLAAGG